LVIGRAENHVTDFANRSVATRSRCRVITHLADFGNAVGNGYGKSNLPQQWQIRNVIANVNAFGFVYAEGLADTFECLNLVRTTQSDMRNTKFLHTNLDCTRFATTDDGDLNAGLEHLSDSKAVKCAKGLAFDARIGEIESTIGEYAINIESNQPDS
jgi:hypothetical protein